MLTSRRFATWTYNVRATLIQRATIPGLSVDVETAPSSALVSGDSRIAPICHDEILYS